MSTASAPVKVVLGDGGGEQIEERLCATKGKPRVVVAPANGQERIHFVVQAGLDHRDVVPSESWATGGAKRSLVGVGVCHRLYLAVENSLGIELHGSLGMNLDGNTSRKVCRDVEFVAFGKQPAVAREPAGISPALISGANIEPATQLADPSHTYAPSKRVGVTNIGDMGGSLDSLALEKFCNPSAENLW